MGDAYSAIGALADPVRRRLYDAVCARDDGLGREEAARWAGVAPHVARFHLDKLVAEGLLSVEHRRLTGRTGPGAGRPANVTDVPGPRWQCRSPIAITAWSAMSWPLPSNGRWTGTSSPTLWLPRHAKPATATATPAPAGRRSPSAPLAWPPAVSSRARTTGPDPS